MIHSREELLSHPGLREGLNVATALMAHYALAELDPTPSRQRPGVTAAQAAWCRAYMKLDDSVKDRLDEYWGDEPDENLTITDSPPGMNRWEAIEGAAELKSLIGWKAMRKAHAGACLYCGATGALTLDHIVPRRLGGRDVKANLAPACALCNSSKGGKDPARWLVRRSDLSLDAIRERWRAAGRKGALPVRRRP